MWTCWPADAEADDCKEKQNKNKNNSPAGGERKGADGRVRMGVCGWARADVLTCRCGGVQRRMTVKKKKGKGKELTQEVVSVSARIDMWTRWRADADDCKEKKKREKEKRKENSLNTFLDTD